MKYLIQSRPDVVSRWKVLLPGETAGVSPLHGHGADAAEDDDDEETDGDGEHCDHGHGVSDAELDC